MALSDLGTQATWGSVGEESAMLLEQARMLFEEYATHHQKLYELLVGVRSLLDTIVAHIAAEAARTDTFYTPLRFTEVPYPSVSVSANNEVEQQPINVDEVRSASSTMEP